jgi:hypothetical protein
MAWPHAPGVTLHWSEACSHTILEILWIFDDRCDKTLYRKQDGVAVKRAIRHPGQPHAHAKT